MGDPIDTAERKRRAWLAGPMSLLLPGLGQVYNGDGRLGAGLLIAISLAVPTGAWLLAALPAAAAAVGMLILILFGAILLIFAVVNAIWRARRLGAVKLVRFQRWYIYLGVYLAAVIWRSVTETLPMPSLESYHIPSSGMSPTIVVGDRLMAKTYAFADRLPQRGEIVLYQLPADPSVIYIHRVIGLPGDRVQWRMGRLYLNGGVIERRRLEDFVDSRSTAPVPQYEEVFPHGPTYQVIETAGDSGVYDDTEVFEVPADHLFVVGDNRDGSLDSRNGRGLVPFGALRDKPLFLYWSSDLSRIGKVVE